MPFGSGAGSWLQVSTTLAGQSSWNTASSGSYLSIPINPGGVTLINEPQFSGQARGADMHHGRSGLVSVTGTEIFEIHPHNLDYFLANFFSLSQTNPVGSVFDHTWTIPVLLNLVQQYGLTLREGMGTAITLDQTKQITSAFVLSIQLAVTQSNFMVCTVGIIAANRAFTTITPSFGTQVPMVVSGNLTVDVTTPDLTVYPNIPVRGLAINLNMPGRLDYSDTNVVAVKFSRTEKATADVSWNWDWDTAEPEPKLRAAFEAKTRVQATIQLLGADLGGGHTETLRFTFPHLLRSGSDPVVAGAGLTPSTMTFMAQRDFANGLGAFTVYTKNNNNIV